MSATDLASVVCRHSPNPFPHLRRAARRTAQQATRMKAVFIAIVCAVNVVAQIPATPAPIVPSVPPSLAQSLTIQVCESSTRCTAWTGLMGTCVMTSGTGVSGSIIQNAGSAIFTTNSVFWYSDARCTQLAFYFNMYSSNNPLSLERSNNPTSYLTSLTSAGGGSGIPIPVTSAQGIILGSLLVKAQAQQKAVTSEDTSSTPGGANTLAVALYGSPTCASLLTTLLHSSITPGCVAATAYSSTSSFSWSCDGFGNTLIKVYLWSSTCSDLQPDVTTGFIPADGKSCSLLSSWYFGNTGMKLLSSPCATLPATPGYAATSGGAASAASASAANVASIVISVAVCLAIGGMVAAFFYLGGATCVASKCRRRPLSAATILASKPASGSHHHSSNQEAVLISPNPIFTERPTS